MKTRARSKRSIALIAVGVLVPLGVPGTDLANFVAYIVRSVWLLAFATLIWRRPVHVDDPAQQLEIRGSTARLALET